MRIFSLENTNKYENLPHQDLGYLKFKIYKTGKMLCFLTKAVVRTSSKSQDTQEPVNRLL